MVSSGCPLNRRNYRFGLNELLAVTCVLTLELQGVTSIAEITGNAAHSKEAGYRSGVRSDDKPAIAIDGRTAADQA